MPSEFNLIQQHFTRPTRHTGLGVGDDAALISLSPNCELAISADMLVAGTHFFHETDPETIGWKSLAVNVSDMAAMGAVPKWATLAIALPEADEAWLTGFSRGFFACAEAFNIDLIGGDTTRGALTLSVQIMGEVPQGKALKRSGAKIGDEVWVSGTLGDAALALAHLQGKLTLTEHELAACAKALHTPQPRVVLGLALRDVAHGCIDVSDGLLADLGHVLESSKVGADIHLAQIPCSAVVQCRLSEPAVQAMALAGGDDYELCFTAPASAHEAIINIGQQLDLRLTCIGKVTAEKGLRVLDDKGLPVHLPRMGYDHFG